MQTVFPRLAAIVIRALSALCLVLALAPGAGAQTPAERALVVYEQGKKLYDARDYAGARSKFIEAIRAEPGNPRWHYNLGLTHRQMGNDQAARQSLLKARELDPNYKRAEIEQKLASMGFAGNDANAASATNSANAAAAGAVDAAASNASPASLGPEVVPISDDEALSLVLWLVGGTFALVIGFIALVFWLVRRGGSAVANAVSAKAPKRSGPAPSAAEIGALHGRLDAASSQLVQVEHALRHGEHADLRSRLDHATRIEQAIRSQLDDAAAGDSHAFRKADRAIGELEESTGHAKQLATVAFGDNAFSGQGEKVACYFCARPLANSEYRRPVALKKGTDRADVVACPDCAQASAQGEAPSILAGNDGRTHWSEIRSFDPYAARHAATGETRRIPAWKFAPQRSFGELALLAGGAALAGGALAAMLRPGEAHADEPLLDLDAARESGIAQEAARATAQRASEQRSSSLSDHS